MTAHTDILRTQEAGGVQSDASMVYPGRGGHDKFIGQSRPINLNLELATSWLYNLNEVTWHLPLSVFTRKRVTAVLLDKCPITEQYLQHLLIIVNSVYECFTACSSVYLAGSVPVEVGSCYQNC